MPTQLDLWPGMPLRNYPHEPKEVAAFLEWSEATLTKLIATETDENVISNFITGGLYTLHNIKYELGLETEFHVEPEWLETMAFPRYRQGEDDDD